MKIKAPWKCDYCDTVKGENNHWFLRQANSQGFFLYVWREADAGREIDGVPQFEHICGSVCAGKALEKWISGAPK